MTLLSGVIVDEPREILRTRLRRRRHAFFRSTYPESMSESHEVNRMPLANSGDILWNYPRNSSSKDCRLRRSIKGPYPAT